MSENTLNEDAELTKKEQKEFRKKLEEEKKDNKKRVSSVDSEIKETKAELNTDAKTVNIKSDSEMNTAFFLIFADVLDIFKKEIDKVKKRVLKEKLELYENIRAEYVKHGELTKVMLEKTALLDSDKNKLLEFSEKIKEVSNGADKENFSIKDLLAGSNRIAENAKNFSVADVLGGKFIDTVENVSSDKNRDTEKPTETEDFEKNKQRDKSRNDLKLRAR